MSKMEKISPATLNPWDHMRKAQLRSERNRLIKMRVITPAYAMKPQLMVKSSIANGDKVDGVWKPEIKTHVL